MKLKITFKESPAEKFNMKVKSGQIGKLIDEKMREAEETKERIRKEKMEAAEIDKITFENTKDSDWFTPAKREASSDP